MISIINGSFYLYADVLLEVYNLLIVLGVVGYFSIC